MKQFPEILSTELEIIRNKSEKLSKNTGISDISSQEVRYLAKRFGLSVLEIEIAALQKNIMPAHYERNYNTIDFPEQIQLLSSTVAVIGCGGLGGNVIEMLARLGIGNLIVVDGDNFNEKNLNRQLLSTEKKIGQNKAEVAAARIKEINSGINSKSYPKFVDSANIQEVIQGADLVIDALDNIPARFVVEKACREYKIPFIHGAVNDFNGQVSTIFPQDKGLEVFYGSPQKYNQQNNTIRIPVPSVTPTMIASFQVAEAIKVLLKRGKTLRNKLLLINLEESDINVLEIN